MREEIVVTYYEHYKSEFFSRWLGIPEKDAFFYLGGKNRIYADIYGIHCVLELSEDEVERELLEKTSPFKVESNQLLFSNPIERMPIIEIRRGKKRYERIEDFFQEYIAVRYELTYYQDQYKNIVQSLDPLYLKYIDDDDALIAISSEGEQIKVKKRNPNFNILFAGHLASDGLIEFRESFFNQLFTNFINNEHTRIFHAGMEVYGSSQGPFKIGSLEIFNKIKSDIIIANILEFIQKINIVDTILKKALYYSIFQLLNKNNKERPISYLFAKFADEIGKNIQKSDTVLQNETDIIEFKSRDFLVGRNGEISKRISEDIKKKISSHPFKIYFIDIEDATKKLEPLVSSRFSSDRISSIQKKIANELGNEFHLSLLKIPLAISDDCLLMMFVVWKW